MTSEINRRTFLKIVISATIGGLISECSLPLGIAANQAVEQQTNFKSGNAAYETTKNIQCSSQQDRQKCIDTFQPTTSEKIYGVTIGPVIEEIQFRGLPSFFLSIYEKKENPAYTTLMGTHELKISRREFICGIISSLLFSLAHNITESGVNTDTIPASIAVDGMILWLIQRKIGIAGNIAAHSWHNYRAITWNR